MPLYRLWGSVLASDFEIGHLSFESRLKPDIKVDLRSSLRRPPGIRRVQRLTDPAGRTYLEVSRRHDEFFLRFPRLAEFQASADGRRVLCRPARGLPGATLRHLIIDQVVPLLLSRRGGLVLHAAAVAVAGGAVLFLGATGSGKSTLAGSFGAAGLPLLADDCVVLRRRERLYSALPGPPAIRLWPDSAVALFGAGFRGLAAAPSTRKRVVDLGASGLAFQGSPLPLRRVYVLETAASGRPSSRIEEVSGSDVFEVLLTSACRLDPTNRAELRREFDALTDLAALPVFRRLVFGRGFARLPDVREEILREARRAPFSADP
jgi:hypothetical protein